MNYLEEPRDDDLGEISLEKVITMDQPQTKLSFSPSGELLASYSENFGITIFKCPDLTIFKLLDQSAIPAHDMSWDGSGRFLGVATSNGTVKIFDITDDTETKTIFVSAINMDITSIKFHMSKNLLATGGRDNVIKFWNAENGRFLRKLVGHRGVITSLDFSPSGYELLSTSFFDRVMIWSTSSGRPIRNIPVRFVESAQFSSKPNQILIAVEWEVHLVNYATMTLIRRFSGFPPVRFAPLLKKYMIMTFKGLFVHVLNIRNGRTVKIVRAHNAEVLAQATNGMGAASIATAGADGELKLWRVEEFQQ